MPSVAESAHVTSAANTQSRAKQLWMELIKEATAHKVPSRKTPDGEGYLLNTSLAVVGEKLWGRKAADFLPPVRSHLKKHKNVTFATTQQIFISKTYNEGKRKKSPALLPTTEEQSIFDRSRSVWANARSHCERNGYPSEVHEGVLFYRVDKPLSYFITAVFPDMLAYEGGRRPIYEFLRSTCNAVNLNSKTRDDDEAPVTQHAWLIRDSWNDSGTVVMFRTLTPDAIDKRAQKLTPHEAGEDRPPAPVEVRRVQPTKDKGMTTATPAVPTPSDIPAANFQAPSQRQDDGKNEFICPEPGCDKKFETLHQVNGHRSSHYPRNTDKRPASARPLVKVAKSKGHAIKLDDGRVQCDECDQIFDTMGQISGHKKIHYNERRDAEIERLARENRRLRSKRASTAGGKEMSVEVAIRTLTEALESVPTLTDKIESLEALNEQLQNRISQLQAELTDEKRSGDVQTMVELLQNIVNQVNAGTIAPIRGMADVDDLLRGMQVK